MDGLNFTDNHKISQLKSHQEVTKNDTGMYTANP